MPRYFMEVFYKGTDYSGFQTQKNANSIQAEIEKAFFILQKEKVLMTGSSRTDTGVHALQNFFHFDADSLLHPETNLERGAGDEGYFGKLVYKINAILPCDIVVKNITLVSQDAHCRFDALSREYKYFIYQKKQPFLKDRSYYFPYKLDIAKMQQAAEILKEYNDFTSFSKRNTQVRSFICRVEKSEWFFDNDQLVYHIRANRFLRGMVRALTATMLKVGRGTISVNDFISIIEAKDCTKASFAVPPHGLFLIAVQYPYIIQ
jgi:tRNA pseudouridine38-40 synthase